MPKHGPKGDPHKTKKYDDEEKQRNLLKKLSPHARKALASKKGKLKDTGSFFGLTKGGKAYVSDRIGPTDAMESLVHKLTGKK